MSKVDERRGRIRGKLAIEVRVDEGWRMWTKVGESRRRVAKIEEDLKVEESGPNWKE